MINWSPTSPLITGLKALRVREGVPSFDGWSIAELLRGERLAPSHFEDGASHRRTFDRDQPRVPAGHSDGGQWTRDGGSGASIDDPRVLSDATPDNDWIPGANYAAVGHHWVTREFYRKLPFSRETRKVFRDSTSGPLPWRVLDERWQREYRHQFDKAHQEYNVAIYEFLTVYMSDRGIRASQMTPDQAREALRAIHESTDPRIRRYNEMIRFMRRVYRLYRLRSGSRGGE